MMRSIGDLILGWLHAAAGLAGRVLNRWPRRPSRTEQPEPNAAARFSTFGGGFLLLAVLAVLSVAFVAAVIGQAWHAIRQTVERAAEEKAELALESMVAVRQYVADVIRPEFQKKRGGEDEFIPEVMSSSFVARAVFGRVRERLPNFLLRFPSTNPRNPFNQASEQERLIIRQFEQDPAADAWSGTIEHDGRTFLARAKPRRLTRPCLQCHGAASDAPKTLVSRYGPSQGFGNAVGDVSIDLVGISVSDTLAAAWNHLWGHMLLAAGLGVLFLGGAATAVCLDVRRRRRYAETLRMQKEELARERAKLQAIFDSVQVGLLLIDEKTRIVRVNNVGALSVGKCGPDMLNCKPGDGLCCIHAGQSPEGCGHAPACRDCVTRNTIETVFAEQRPLGPVEAALDLSVGGQRKRLWVSLCATPLELEGKKHVLLAVVDVTQRREAEQRCRALFESSHDALMTLAPPRWRFTSGNPAALALFGMRDEAELTSCWLSELSPPTQPDGRISSEKAIEMIETAMREGVHHFEWIHKRRGGREFPASVMLTRVDVGNEAFLLATVRDVTEQKESERKQIEYAAALERQRAEMETLYRAAEAATRAKSEFLANMSHEIRTPMTAILGYADLVDSLVDSCEQSASGCKSDAWAQIRAHLATVRRNGHHLLQIINDILDLSKIEANKLDVDWQTVSPAAILADVVSLMRVRADAKGLDLKLEFAGPVPEAILTDPARVRQILLNLIGNAIKFTEKGGVRVVARTDMSNRSRPRFICEVVDTGKGMTEEQIRGLFRPFSQADASTSRKYGGTGLGLAISKRLAGLLKGDITVSSQPGVGTTFVLSIDPGPLDGVAFHPQSTEAIAAPQPAPQPPRQTSLAGCRVLLAEDGIDNQRLIAFLLKKAGAEVTAVENGRQALEMAGVGPRPDEREPDAEPPTPFDLILMDMQMPVMDGYEATRRLRAQGYRGPIIALTAHAMADDRQKCLDAGCDDYLSKPIDRVTLLTAIARHWNAAQSGPKDSNDAIPVVQTTCEESC